MTEDISVSKMFSKMFPENDEKDAGLNIKEKGHYHELNIGSMKLIMKTKKLYKWMIKLGFQFVTNFLCFHFFFIFFFLNLFKKK
jgi:hypothetical protein